MLRRYLPILAVPILLSGAIVLDRIAVAVGSHAIKSSDIERDLRVTQFLNREPLDLTSAAKQKRAAERLIDQEIIRDEIAIAGFSGPGAADVDAWLTQLRRDRFGGSEAAMTAALAKYGITPAALRAHLAWQLTVIRFIDQRFRPGVLVTDEDVRSWYNDHLAELRKEYPRNGSLEALEPKIRQSIEGERINTAFEDWLKEARQRTRVQYLQEGLQGGMQ